LDMLVPELPPANPGRCRLQAAATTLMGVEWRLLQPSSFELAEMR